MPRVCALVNARDVAPHLTRTRPIRILMIGSGGAGFGRSAAGPTRIGSRYSSPVGLSEVPWGFCHLLFTIDDLRFAIRALEMGLNKVQRQKTSVALLSVVSNTTLVVLKIVIGLMIGSVSVISEAIHSGVDLLAALIALFAVRTSGKPADEEHPFGHGKIENISGTVEALLIFVAAVWIIYEAVGD